MSCDVTNLPIEHKANISEGFGEVLKFRTRKAADIRLADFFQDSRVIDYSQSPICFVSFLVNFFLS